MKLTLQDRLYSLFISTLFFIVIFVYLYFVYIIN